MTMTLTSGPADEPVTLADARAFLRLDDETEDALLGALITAARLTLELVTRRAFMTQSWRLSLDQWPGRQVMLPMAPVLDVSEIRVDGGTLDETLYKLDLTHEPPRVVLKKSAVWPQPSASAGGIEIDIVAGFGSGVDVPQPLKQALLMLVAHWFEHREPVAFGGSQTLPLGVDAVIAPWRRPHL